MSALAPGTGGRTVMAVRSTGDGEAAEVWDTRTHRTPRTLHGLFGQAVAVRPDGRLLVGSADQYADLPSGKVTGWALADGREVTALAFSPDSTRLAVGDTTGHVTLWDGDLRHATGVLTGTADTAPSSRAEAVGALACDHPQEDDHAMAVRVRQARPAADREPQPFTPTWARPTSPLRPSPPTPPPVTTTPTARRSSASP
ncbi:hypothetical protein GCM10027074_66600 [Streptomyces deserti]